MATPGASAPDLNVDFEDTNLKVPDLQDFCKARALPIKQGSRRFTKLELVDSLTAWQREEHAKLSAPVVDLNIDLDTFQDRFGTMNQPQLLAEVTARGITVPRNGLTKPKLMRQLEEWAQKNAARNKRTATISTALSQPDSKKKKSTEQIPVATSNAMTIVPNMWGSAEASPTHKTPLEDQTLTQMFTSSFESASEIIKKNSCTKHLISMPAIDLVVGNTIAYFVGIQGIILIYSVIGTATTYISIEAISRQPSHSELPPLHGRIAPQTIVLGLSQKCIQAFRTKMQEVHAANPAYDLQFPVTVKACIQPLDVPAEKGERLRFDVADDVRFFDKTAAPIEVSSASNADLVSAMRDAIDPARSGAAREKTARPHMTDAQAAVLSATPTEMLKQGNVAILLTLTCTAATVSASSSSAAHAPTTQSTRHLLWDLKDPYRTQIQPAHLIRMWTKITSVDIRMFADITPATGKGQADQLIDEFITHDKDIDTSRGPDLQIVGPHYDRFERLIKNFAFTMDTMFMLHDEIRQEWQMTVRRLLAHASSYNLDITESTTPLVLLFWSHSLQSHFSRLYDCVRGNTITNTSEAVRHLKAFPPTDASDFTRGEQSIFGQGRLPQSFPLIIAKSNQTPGSTFTTGSQSWSSPLLGNQLNFSGGGKRGGAVGGKKSGTAHSNADDKKHNNDQVCGFYLSEGGCSKPGNQCSRKHRKLNKKNTREVAWFQQWLADNGRTAIPKLTN